MSKYLDKSLFGERLLEVMKDNDDTTYSLGEYLHLSPSAISRYTAGENAPKVPTVHAIAERYHINPAWLMGAAKVGKYLDEPMDFKKVPILGTIAAGSPLDARENIQGYESVPDDVHVDFCLFVQGDSMINARILDGDLVYIRKQPDVESGEIAAVLIDEETATLKRVYKVNGMVILRAENPNYPDRIFAKKDLVSVRIMGKAIQFKSEVR